MNLLDLLDKGIAFLKTEISRSYHSLKEFEKTHLALKQGSSPRTERFLLDSNYIADVYTTIGGFTMPQHKVRHYIWTEKGWDRYCLLKKLSFVFN